MKLAPGGENLAYIGPGGVYSANLIRGMIEDEFTEHENDPFLLDLSPNGKLILSGESNGHVNIRSFPRGQYHAKLDLDFSLSQAVFTPEGRSVLFGGKNGELVRFEPHDKSHWLE